MIPTGKTSRLNVFQKIPNFTLLVGWTGQVAITDSLIQATEKKRKVATDSAFYKEFLAKSHAIVQGLQTAWNKQDIPALQEGIRANRALLNQFAKVMQLEIETPALQTLCDLAEKAGACAKTSGAGGGRLWDLLYTKRNSTTTKLKPNGHMLKFKCFR